MPSPAISATGVGKRFKLGRGYGVDSRLSSRIDAAVRAPLRFLTGRGDGRASRAAGAGEFWALRDVSFEIPKGQAVGLIGANGAGKSTLLKLLAQITVPSEGHIRLRGLTGSLLEVGTGFHPDLTGRDNIFLNGAILGMRRREIMARYDEIVEFSEIPEFIDTPVKRYSSGMWVRLAFAIAAHLEPDVLLVDEVLAVGDISFQRKFLAKMDEVSARTGQTIIFVSHNMTSVRELCERVMLIHGGRLVSDGPPDGVIAEYLERAAPTQHGGVAEIGPQVARSGSGEARLRKVSLLSDQGDLIESVRYGQPFTVAIEIEAERSIPEAVFSVRISSGEGIPLLVANSIDGDGTPQSLERGVSEIRVRINATLLPGEFAVDASITNHATGMAIDWVDRAISVSAINAALPGSEKLYPLEAVHAPVRANAEWSQNGAPRALAAPDTAPTPR